MEYTNVDTKWLHFSQVSVKNSELQQTCCTLRIYQPVIAGDHGNDAHTGKILYNSPNLSNITRCRISQPCSSVVLLSVWSGFPQPSLILTFHLLKGNMKAPSCWSEPLSLAQCWSQCQQEETEMVGWINKGRAWYISARETERLRDVRFMTSEKK